MFTPDLSGLQACIDDVKAASLDSDSGPPEPTGFPSLMQRLETSRALLPKVFQISTADPFISSLNGIGETGYVQTLAADPTREGTAGLLLDIAQAILQKGEGYSPDATDAFLEVVADLYDGFLSAEDRSGIKMPERVSVPPLVMRGNPDFGPSTWPFDATNHFGVKNAVVSMPPSNTRSGLMAWSALGHETCGHDVLHANAGLQGEIARLVRAALAKEPPLDDKHTHLSSYWATRIDETSSDVMGILNMGPAAAIGLVAYFRGLSAGAGSPAKLRRDGPADDPHPADSLRGYLAAATLRLLSFSDREGWAKAIEAQTDHDVGAGNSVRVAGNKITQEQAKISARIVAETIAAAPTHILNHHSLLDIQDWRDSDEQIVVALRTALLSGNNPSAAFQPGVYATHVVAAATTAALAGAAAPALLFRRMIQMLKALSTRNPTWGPLAIVHRGSIARDFVFIAFNQIPHAAYNLRPDNPMNPNKNYKEGDPRNIQPATISYTRDEVFDKLCNDVYPECSKQPDQIRPFHSLVADLGYKSGAIKNLATKTNSAFELTPPNYFIGSDFDDIATVRTHHNSTCELLTKDGRLL